MTKNDKIYISEIDPIFINLKTKTKRLITYPLSGHENYLRKYKNKWTVDVSNFIELTKKHPY